MNVLLIIFLGWVIPGICGFIFWWTSEYNLTVEDLPGAIVVGLLAGPTTFVIGYSIHSHSGNKVILVKKRNSSKSTPSHDENV